MKTIPIGHTHRWLLALALSMPLPASAETFALPHAEENAAWQKITLRFTGEPTAEKDSEGRLKKVTVEKLTKNPRGAGVCSLVLDPESGRVVQVVSNVAAFSNDEYDLFVPFQKLQRLTLWHNSRPDKKADSETDYDGAGLAKLVDLPQLTHVTLAGGDFGDRGMEAAAKLPKLESLGMWHCAVTDAGFAHFAGKESFKQVRLGPFWAERITNTTLGHLATCPNITSIGFGETWLTYEGGLERLAACRETLEKLDLGNTLVEPADVAKVKALLPNTEVMWEGLSGAGKVLSESAWHKSKADQWIPADLIERALAAHESS